MFLNQATDYAFRSVLYLATQPKGKLVEAQAIAQHEKVPMRFLLKIMPSLIKAGIVQSQRGVGGGYYLVKNPSEISFFDIVKAIEGDVAINKCLVDPAYCNKNAAAHCKVHRALEGIQQKITDELKGHNFGELLRE